MSEHPLTYYQMRLWYLDQLEPNTSAHNMSFAYRLLGSLDVGALNKSVNSITERHQNLRAVFTKGETDPFLVIQNHVKFSIEKVSIEDIPENARESETFSILSQETERGFDLARGPMCRWLLIKLDDREHILVFTVHRIIADIRSMATIVRELMKIYSAAVSGDPVSLEPLKFNSGDYALAEAAWMNSEECLAQISYWKNKLGKVPEPLELPTDFPRPAFQRYRSSGLSMTLEPGICSKLKKLALESNSSLFVVTLAGFKSLLFRYSGQEDICVGTYVDNRKGQLMDEAVGSFVNTIAIRTDMNDDPEFNALLRRLSDNVRDSFANRDVPFERLLDEIKPERSLSRTPIFQVMMVFQESIFPDLVLTGLESNPIDLNIFRSNFDLQMWISESENGLEILLEYGSDLFSEQTISRMLEHFKILLENACLDPDRRVSQIGIIGEKEKSIILDEWGRLKNKFVIPGISVIEAFENNATMIPDKVALLDLHGDSGIPQELTYLELNCKANKLAHYLRERNIGPEIKVALLLEPYSFLIIGLFGVLKAGGAYVPLDAKWPNSRINFILNDTAAPLVITDRANMERLRDLVLESSLDTRPDVICIDREWESINTFSAEDISEKPGENQAAYLIYTSGSTGKPKGVIIEHEALALFTDSAIRLYGFNQSDRVFQFSSPSFDSSVEEIFCSLISGATLVLRSNAMLTSMTSFAMECINANITVLDLPTAFWQQLTSSLEEGAISLPESLRMVIIGGEQPATEKFRSWQKNAPGQISLMNTYGPTETTVIVTAIDLSSWNPPETSHQQIPMGKPLEHVRAYILDRNFAPTPIGVPGELCIGGRSLARGYLNLPEKTAEKFMIDPFGDSSDERIYRTGDRVRYLEDGQMEFFGRVDRQVKVRGFRVELDEIDNALRGLPNLSEAFTISRQKAASPVQLVAFVVCQPGSSVEPAQLRDQLKTRLPDFMIPSSFVILDKFPLTSGGKIDAAALRDFEISADAQMDSFLAPRTPVEEVLVNIWRDIFGLERIGVKDNFFDLGGHSLLSLQIIDRVNKAGLRLTPAEFIQNPTIDGQARLITTAKPFSDEGMWKCLVQLQSHGSFTPLYLVHSNPGDVLGYVNLVNRLGMDQPCYGFESLGLRDMERAHKSVEEMATFYIDEMIAFQPQPPYYLGGWCYGGIVAMEMAYQLQLRGKEVGLLALIETPFPKMATARVSYYLNKLLGLIKLGPKGWAFYVRNKIKYMRRVESGSIDSIFSLDLDAGVFSNRPKVYRLNSLAMAHYCLKAFPSCPVRMFVGDTHEEGFIPDIDMLWTAMSKDIRRFVVPGTHMSILKEPGVSAVAKILRECLTEVEETRPDIPGKPLEKRPEG